MNSNAILVNNSISRWNLFRTGPRHRRFDCLVNHALQRCVTSIQSTTRCALDYYITERLSKEYFFKLGRKFLFNFPRIYFEKKLVQARRHAPSTQTITSQNKGL